MRISEITATSVHISWHYDGPPSEAVEFVIQYKPKLAPAQDYAEIIGLKTNYYTVQNLIHRIRVLRGGSKCRRQGTGQYSNFRYYR